MAATYKPSNNVSARMKKVRQRNTAPELAVRGILTKLGVRYRVCVKSLPGSPDIANRRRAWAVFVNGCFWHGHRGCKYATVPKTNSSWWLAKIEQNRFRDGRKSRLLRRLGFRVITVWQCELDRPNTLERKLRSKLEMS